MTKIVLVVIAFAAIVCANEVEDSEQKKRGTGKTTSLNSIPTGAQKPDYSYNLYPQTSNTASNSQSTSYQTNPSYQSVSNSFYPSQTAQYYTPNSPPESHYQQQSQINLIPPTTSSQFVPLNFLPSTGFQAKYQIIPSKNSHGSLQLAIVQPPTSFPTPSLLQYPQPILQPNPNQLHQQQNPFGSISPHTYFNVAPNYQPLIGSPHIGQPSAMVLVSQPNPSLYNNLLYPNPVQSFYNYYPSNSQAKYSLSYGPPQPSEYEKLQGSISQGIQKEDTDVNANSDYAASDVNSSYKNSYSASRGSSYTKL